MKWFSERDLAVNARVRLFCFPHAGSGAAGFYRWKRLLPPWIAVCPVLLPGREARFAEPAAVSAAEIVAAVAGELEGALPQLPFAVYGHSMGSLLAFEWARTLPREGPCAPVALFVSGRDDPGHTAGSSAPEGAPLHTLDDAALVAALRRRYGDHGAGLLDDPELRAMFLPGVRADLGLVETYRAAAGEPLRCPLAAFAGSEDGHVSEAGLRGWAAVTSGGFTSGRLPGDHFFHFGAGQAEWLRVLERTLAMLLAMGPAPTGKV